MFHAPGDMEVTRVGVYTAVRSLPTYLCCSWLNLKLCPCQVVELASMWLLHRTLPADKFEGLPMFKCGISYEDTLGLAKELDVPLKIHCGVPCYVGWSVFILLNIRTFFLANTLHIIRRESWKIHVTIPTVSPPFNGVYVTHERQPIYAVWGTSQLLSYTWVADKNSERSSSLQWYMNLSRQLGEMCSVRQVRLRDGTLLLSNPHLLTKHLDSESRTEVLPSPAIIASWKLGNINSAHNQTCLDC